MTVKTTSPRPTITLFVMLCSIALAGCSGPEPGTVKDEAMQAGRTVASLAGSDSDYLKDMDRGLDAEAVHKALQKFDPAISKDQAWKSYNRGRNNWVVWTAGNDTLWDYLGNNSFGAFDLLKTVSSHPAIQYCGNKTPYGYPKAAGGAYGGAYAAPRAPAPYPPGYWVYDDDACSGNDRQFFEVSRANRWKYLGLVNEPGFEAWTPPAGCDWKNDKAGKCGDPNRFGLWLDKKVGPPDPFADENAYPGVKIGARGSTVPVGSYYGWGTGVVGLRLLPNPK